MQSILFRAALAASILGAQAQAQVFFQNATGLSSPTNTVTFSEVVPAVNTPMTTQYQAHGLTFSSSVYYAPAYDHNFNTPNIDPTRSLGNFIQFVYTPGPFAIYFTSPVTAAALAVQTANGSIDVALYSGGVAVPGGTRTFNGGLGSSFTNNFIGASGVLFDEIRITRVNTFDRALVFDNVQFILPPPPNRPPSVICPEPTTIPCAPAEGMAVTLQAAVSDPDAGQTLTVNLKEGSVILDTQSVAPTPVTNAEVAFAEIAFPPGEHSLTIEVSDGTDTISCSTTLTILADTLPPQFTRCPANRTVEATGPAGAVVTYEPAVAEDDCGEVTITYSHPSGSLFPVGQTTVVCTARDAAGLESTCSFQITVVANDACDLIQALIDEVNALPNLHHGTRNALVVKLQAALAACSAGDLAAACERVQDFINLSRAQSGKKLSRAVALDWIADANAIRQALGCP